MSLDSSQELRVDTNEADCMNVGGSLAHDFARCIMPHRYLPTMYRNSGLLSVSHGPVNLLSLVLLVQIGSRRNVLARMTR